MIFNSQNEKMEWKILQYQYPEETASTETDYNYNANWLQIQVSHLREGYGPAVFRESFLLTYEIQEIIDALEKLLAGEIFHHKAEFVEPILELEIARHIDKFLVSFDLAFDGYEMMVANTLTIEELEELIGQFRTILAEYPER